MLRALTAVSVAFTLVLPTAVAAQSPAPVATPGLDTMVGPAGTPQASPRTVAGGGARDSLAAARFREGEGHERAFRRAQAVSSYGEAIRRAVTSNDSVTLADARYRTGIVYWSANRYDSALVFLEAARDVRQRIGDEVELARVLNGIGASYYQLGVYEPALDAFVPSARMRRATRDSLGLARTLTNIGKVYHDWGQRDRARRTLEQAVDVAQHASNGAPALGYAYNSLATLAVDERRFNDARTFIARSREAYAAPGHLRSRADSIDSWESNAAIEGYLLLREGKPRQALALLDTVLVSATSRGSIRGRAMALLRSGEAHALLNDPQRAQQHFNEALLLAQRVGQRMLALEALDRLSRHERSRGNAELALQYLTSFQALRDTIFDQDAALRIAAREAREETDAALEANRVLQATSAEQDETIARQRTTLVLGGLIVVLSAALLIAFARLTRSERLRASALARANSELAQVNRDLTAAVAEVKTLSGLIPICANCKKVRDDRGYWEQVETFVTERSNATFSHSICQSCGPELYGDLWNGTESAGAASPPSP